MSQPRDRSQTEHIRLVEDDDLLGVVGDSRLLLPVAVKEVDAVCIDVRTISFRNTKDPKLEFMFQVADPEQYAGTRLLMYVRNPGWKKLPVSSKMWKVARVATGGQLKRGQKITKSLFVGKLFRCKVRSDKNGHYTVIDTIVEKLTG